MRYFYGENADRPIRVGTVEYPFEIISRVGGTSQGIAVVPDDQAEAFLAVAAPYGVEEVAEGIYLQAVEKKKKRPAIPVSVEPRPPLLAALKGKGAVVGPGGSTETKSKDSVPLDLEDALFVEKIKVGDMPPTETAANHAKPRAPRAARASASGSGNAG